MKKLFSVLLLVVLSLSVASAAMARTVTADGTVVRYRGGSRRFRR